MISKQDVLDRVVKLPTLSATTTRLYALAANEGASLNDFVEVVHLDPALTTNLLKLANSAFFGLPCKVGTVGRAIAMMGTKQIFKLVTAALFARTVPDRLPGYNVEAHVYWQHCVAVAVLSDRFAEEIEVEAPNLAFTAGLLHDIGKLVLGSFLDQTEASREFLAQVNKGDTSLVATEKAVLGLDHAEIGAEIAAHWKLPPEVGWSCRWHHDPGQAPPDVDRKMVELIHVADVLAHTLGFGTDEGELPREIDHDVVERLGIKVRSLEHVASETVHEIRSLADVLTPGSGGGR